MQECKVTEEELCHLICCHSLNTSTAVDSEWPLPALPSPGSRQDDGLGESHTERAIQFKKEIQRTRNVTIILSLETRRICFMLIASRASPVRYVTSEESVQFCSCSLLTAASTTVSYFLGLNYSVIWKWEKETR